MGKKTLFWDLDGTIAKWNNNATMDDIVKPGYFANIEPEKQLVRLVNNLIHDGTYDIYILSHYMPETTAYEDKLKWVKKYMPKLDLKHCLLVPCGVDKATYIRDIRKCELPKDYVLIDDFSTNLRNWHSAGGTAIKWLNGINGTCKSSNGTFLSGDRIDNAIALERVISELEQKGN